MGGNTTHYVYDVGGGLPVVAVAAHRTGARGRALGTLVLTGVLVYLVCVPVLLLWVFLTTACGAPWRSGFC